VTTSTLAGSVAAASERRVRARTGTPAASKERVYYKASNPAGRSGDEDRRHSRPCHDELDVVRGRCTDS
jgi:hypothetical protein